MYLFAAVQLAASGYAILRGGMPERLAGAALVAAALLSFSLQSALATRFGHLEWGVLAVDLALFAGLLALALHADRWWTLVLAALQGLGAGAHLVKAINPETIRVIYAILIAVWSYPIMLVLVMGTWRHGRRVGSTGADRDWSAGGEAPL